MLKYFFPGIGSRSISLSDFGCGIVCSSVFTNGRATVVALIYSVDELLNSPTSTRKKLDSLITGLESSYQVLTPSRTLFRTAYLSGRQFLATNMHPSLLSTDEDPLPGIIP
jgi:hypothetical protein